MKSWNVIIRDTAGHVVATVPVDASTRRAARVAGLAVLARRIGRPDGRVLGVGRVTASPAGDALASLVRKLRGRMSARMAWLMGGILGHDFGAKDSHGNTCGPISVTSDGFALGAMGNAFIGDVADVERNFRGLLEHVHATDRERAAAEARYRERVSRR